MTGLEALPFLGETGHVISLVGGGGKTTLLYALARHYSAQGQRVLVSTTTHIQRPDANCAPMRRRETHSGRLVPTPWWVSPPEAGS